MQQPTRTAGVGRRSSAAAAPAYEAGVYLTDEVFLYRLVDVLVTEAGVVADVEDCHELDVVRVPVRALQARRLRIVTPAPSRG